MTTIRRTGTTSVAVLSGLALTLGVAQASAPEWVRGAGLDVWNLSEYRDDFRASIKESARLQEEAEGFRQSIEVMDSITARVASEMISLEEATSESEPVLRDRPGFATTAAGYHQAPTLRLSIARYLIARVERQLHGDPSRLAAIARKLEAEYAEMSAK